MEVRKHNARKITETFEYETRAEMKVKELKQTKPAEFYVGKANLSDFEMEDWELGDAVVTTPALKGFKIAGEDGKIYLTFDERDKQQVVDLLRAMADSLDESQKETQRLESLRLILKIHGIEGYETATFDDWDIQFKDGKSIPIKKAGEEMEVRYIPSDAKSWGDKT